MYKTTDIQHNSEGWRVHSCRIKDDREKIRNIIIIDTYLFFSLIFSLSCSWRSSAATVRAYVVGEMVE